MNKSADDQLSGLVEDESSLIQEFSEKYNKLCEEYGCQITTYPALIKRDDGTYSLVVKNGVTMIPQATSTGI